MKPLGDGTSTEDWGYSFDILLGHLRAIIEDEADSARGKRLKFVERADVALMELEQIASDMEAER